MRLKSLNQCKIIANKLFFSALPSFLIVYSVAKRAEIGTFKKVLGALHDFLSMPFPSEATSLSELPILSVDFETRGLNAMTCHQTSQGKSLRVVVEVLSRALAWKVILIHIARIEKQSLRQVCLELYGVSPPLMILDTFVMAKRKLISIKLAQYTFS
jgi:DNA polymerase-3 subunit epsilon